MPVGVSDVEVAVAGRVVVVGAQHGGGEPVDQRMIDKAAQVLALVDEGEDGRATFEVVSLFVVASAVGGPDALEGLDDAVGFVSERA